MGNLIGSRFTFLGRLSRRWLAGPARGRALWGLQPAVTAAGQSHRTSRSTVPFSRRPSDGCRFVCPTGNPVPKPVHKVISAHQLKAGRLILIGDIHGCFDELCSLLQSVRYDPQQDNLVFVGDIVNKGTQSIEVGPLFSPSYC